MVFRSGNCVADPETSGRLEPSTKASSAQADGGGIARDEIEGPSGGRPFAFMALLSSRPASCRAS